LFLGMFYFFGSVKMIKRITKQFIFRYMELILSKTLVRRFSWKHLRL
jgi:hypothetical protein